MNDEIRHVMHYFYRKGYTAKTAMNKIHVVYKTTYPSYTTAKQMFQEFREREIDPSESEIKKSPKKMEKINAIKSVLDNNSNASVRLIAERTQIP